MSTTMQIGTGRRIRALGEQLGHQPDREAAATILALVGICGSAIGYFTMLFPNPPGTAYVPPAVAFAVSIAAALILLRRRRQAGWAAIGMVLALGAAVITVVMISVPDRTGVYAPYYVCLGIFAFYFFRPRWAFAQVAWIAALYAVAVGIDGPPAPAEQWINGVATTLLVGMLVLTLRTRIDRLHSALAEAALTDELTGLPNRRAFDEQLAREIERAERSGTALSVALVDLDHFKQLNDSSGHLAGDRALHRIGSIVPAAVRGMDWPARFGGDEFAVLFPDAGEAEATDIAGRLREQIATAFGGEEVGLTASVGIAVRSPADGPGPEGLLDRADRALYRAKRLGGDRVEAAADTVQAEAS